MQESIEAPLVESSPKDRLKLTTPQTDSNERLSLSDKLDKIMEAIVFQQQLFLMSLKAMDKLLAEKQSKIIKVN